MESDAGRLESIRRLTPLRLDATPLPREGKTERRKASMSRNDHRETEGGVGTNTLLSGD